MPCSQSSHAGQRPAPSRAEAGSCPIPLDRLDRLRAQVFFAAATCLIASVFGLGTACGHSDVPLGMDPRPEATPLWNDPRPGSWELPLGIGKLPFEDSGHTGMQGEMRRTWDACAPAIAYPGPEVTYAVDVPQDGVLRAHLRAEAGDRMGLLLVSEGGQCLARGGRFPPTISERGVVHLERAVLGGRYLLVVDTHDAAGANYRLEVFLDPPEPIMVGNLWNTYYYVANEADHQGEAVDTPLLTADCEVLAEVPKAFHDDLCIEGSGILADGRVVNYASACTRDCFAAVPCGKRSYKICYMVLDPERYPHGMGSEGRVLEPDRSIAVDRTQIPLGAVLYLPELDGVTPPGRSAPHDGCVRADDVGGAVKGNHIDIFAATRGRWRAWERMHPTRSWFTGILHHPRCYSVPGTAGGDFAGDGLRETAASQEPGLADTPQIAVAGSASGQDIVR